MKEKKKKKVVELERSKKRYSRLQTFRPGFMDEYEKKEIELQQMYTQYVERYRNLEFLEHELEKYRVAEQELIEQNKRRLSNMRVRAVLHFIFIIKKKIKDEEMKILRGEKMQDPDLEEDESPANSMRNSNTIYTFTESQELQNAQARAMRRPRAASGKRPSSQVVAQQATTQDTKSHQQHVVSGTMFGDESDDVDDVEEEDDESSDVEEEEDENASVNQDDEEDDEGNESDNSRF